MELGKKSFSFNSCNIQNDNDIFDNSNIENKSDASKNCLPFVEKQRFQKQLLLQHKIQIFQQYQYHHRQQQQQQQQMSPQHTQQIKQQQDQNLDVLQQKQLEFLNKTVSIINERSDKKPPQLLQQYKIQHLSISRYKQRDQQAQQKHHQPFKQQYLSKLQYSQQQQQQIQGVFFQPRQELGQLQRDVFQLRYWTHALSKAEIEKINSRINECGSINRELQLLTGMLRDEQQKPTHSYIGLIATAILQSDEKKLVLCDIYRWVLDRYPYFRSRGSGWRNSIRHNLSLNDCFVKAGRCSSGKGHYWAVHSANVKDFLRGDFRRKKALKKARKALSNKKDIKLKSAERLDVNVNALHDENMIEVSREVIKKRKFDVLSLLER